MPFFRLIVLNDPGSQPSGRTLYLAQHAATRVRYVALQRPGLV